MNYSSIWRLQIEHDDLHTPSDLKPRWTYTNSGCLPPRRLSAVSSSHPVNLLKLSVFCFVVDGSSSFRYHLCFLLDNKALIHLWRRCKLSFLLSLCLSHCGINWQSLRIMASRIFCILLPDVELKWHYSCIVAGSFSLSTYSLLVNFFHAFLYLLSRNNPEGLDLDGRMEGLKLQHQLYFSTIVSLELHK